MGAAQVSYLLDTHALLYWLFDDSRLSPTSRALIADRANTVFVSAASAWEIATKHRIGKLPSASVLVQDIAGWIARAGLRELPMTVTHAQKAGSFGQPHRDPFDRMIAAQSIIEQVPVVSQDTSLAGLGAQLVW